jgi:hypothetical protein
MLQRTSSATSSRGPSKMGLSWKYTPSRSWNVKVRPSSLTVGMAVARLGTICPSWS